MSIKSDDIELGKSYQLPNGLVRRVFEIIPFDSTNFNGISDQDMIRYEAEKWAYDNNRFGGKTRVKVKVREKMKRSDFANEAAKRID